MDQDLFRQQALARQAQRLRGSLLLTQPLAHGVFTAFLAGLVAVALLFLVRHDYARKQSVSGTLVPDRGLIELRAPASGSLAAVHVAADAEVDAGTPLFTVGFEHTLGGAEAVAELLLDELRVQEAAAQQQLRELAALIVNERLLLELKAGALQRAANLRQRALLAPADYDAVYAQLLQQQNALGRLLLQQAQARAELAELQKQQLRTAAERATTVHAPVRGRIVGIRHAQGMSVAAQEPVVFMLPEASVLQAELWLPGAASGFVAAGQPVNLRFDAFPYQKFGVQRAYIAAVSGSAVLPQAGAPPLFRALATLERQHILAFGAAQPLRPGMAFSADIVVDRRSLFEWLLEPLFSIRGRAGP